MSEDAFLPKALVAGEIGATVRAALALADEPVDPAAQRIIATAKAERRRRRLPRVDAGTLARLSRRYHRAVTAAANARREDVRARWLADARGRLDAVLRLGITRRDLDHAERRFAVDLAPAEAAVAVDPGSPPCSE